MIIGIHHRERLVDHVSFPGSRLTGERVVAASARQMWPAMLEPGGKSPSIVRRDVDVAQLVPALGTAVPWNAGQTCDAQSRILVHRADNLAARTYPGPGDDLTPFG